jgi:Sec-independent protein translocase protein TatA
MDANTLEWVLLTLVIVLVFGGLAFFIKSK